MTSRPEAGRGWRRRVPLILALLIGTFVWKGAFGLFATTRTVTWRFQVPYGDVRRVDLQVWRETALLRRVTLEFPRGADRELSHEAVMRAGQHRGVASLWLAGSPEPQTYALDFEVGSDDVVVLAPQPPDGGVR